MLLGDVEIEYWLEIDLVVLWLKCFFLFYLCELHVINVRSNIVFKELVYP